MDFSNADNVHEGKNQMIVKHSKTVHEEEILCPKCNVNFMSVITSLLFYKNHSVIMKFCNWSSSNLDFPTSVFMTLV